MRHIQEWYECGSESKKGERRRNILAAPSVSLGRIAAAARLDYHGGGGGGTADLTLSRLRRRFAFSHTVPSLATPEKRNMQTHGGGCR